VEFIRCGVKKTKQGRNPQKPRDGPPVPHPHAKQPESQTAQDEILREMGSLAHEKFDEGGHAQFTDADFPVAVVKTNPREVFFHEFLRNSLPDDGLEILFLVGLRRHQENERHPQNQRNRVKPEDFPSGGALLSL